MKLDSAHHEKHLERYIVDRLIASGWLEGVSSEYHKEYALYPQDVVGWIKASQPEKWKQLETRHNSNTEKVVLERLNDALKKKGTFKVVKEGFDIAGSRTIHMSIGQPEDTRNEAVNQQYLLNRLRVVPQLQYNPVHKWAIDLAFFINGIPVATAEVKTDFTQSVEDAMEQYKKDRIPKDKNRVEPLLSFKRGAVVHFAMSDSDIRMTTELDGDRTVFLPFNQGNNGRAGNPSRDDGEYPIAFFWEEILQRDSWLRIFHSFVHVQKKSTTDARGKKKNQERLVFPRLQQLRAVNLMLADARANGPGMQYLVEHSAGSGKSLTIAWLSHELSKIRHDNGNPYFNSVIVVTDRTVLDSQLQETIKSVDHEAGMIETIRRDMGDSKSRKLSKALMSGAPVIVVTIQTFPYAMELILSEKSLADKNFAVIIDEAHNSQTGATASKLQATLTLEGKDDLKNMTIEELLGAMQASRVKPSNVSYFAFTATPTHKTKMLFGRPPDESRSVGDDNLPDSFDKYPMRQAIEEGFILDVMKNYTPYRTAFNLNEQIRGDKDKWVDKKKASGALAKWMTLHPTNVTQKVDFIIEHFKRNVAGLLGGQAKAMVVTSSRAAVARYKLAFDRKIKSDPSYGNIKALVAFSGNLTGEEINHPGDENLKDDPLTVPEDEVFNEDNMNPEAKSRDLRTEFDKPEYNIMLVADKFQTGFDQPKLAAMYVDKKIGNAVEIVQTFSRLNRTFPGKDEDHIYIIDFINKPEVVLDAFSMFDAGVAIEEVQDPNVVYDIKHMLDEAGIYEHSDIQAFNKALEKILPGSLNDLKAHKTLFKATQRPTEVFNQRLRETQDEIEHWNRKLEEARFQGNEAGIEEAKEQCEIFIAERNALNKFRSDLNKFTRVYTYVAQLIDMGNPDLESFAIFARLLAKRLKGIAMEDIDLNGLSLKGYEIQKVERPDRDPEEPTPVQQPTGPGTDNVSGSSKEFLSEIIHRLNKMFGEAAPIEDQIRFTNGVAKIVSGNSIANAQIVRNPKDIAKQGELPQSVESAIRRMVETDDRLAELLLDSDGQIMDNFLDVVYDIIKSGEELRLEVKD